MSFGPKKALTWSYRRVSPSVHCYRHECSTNDVNVRLSNISDWTILQGISLKSRRLLANVFNVFMIRTSISRVDTVAVAASFLRELGTYIFQVIILQQKAVSVDVSL